MPSTFSNLHVHVVFSTKFRSNLISKRWRTRLHQYVGGAIREQKAQPVEVGGTVDHIHLLISFRPCHCISDLIREVKRSSSHWIKNKDLCDRFSWQEGYAAFSVGPESVGKVSRYIQYQDEHHRQLTYTEEFRHLLKLSGVEFGQDDFLDEGESSNAK